MQTVGNYRIEQMNLPTTILMLLLIITSLSLYGQLDPVQQDLKNLNDLDFFRKYSMYDKSSTKGDIEITKRIWSTAHLRRIDSDLQTKGVPTFTSIEERPSKEIRYYLVSYYQLPTPDHSSRMGSYRVCIDSTTISYQSIGTDQWEKIQ